MIDNNPTQSFDRMRSMLVRAAEVRDSEQQQIFDSLDEIHGRLATLDSLGAMRKRLADVPDRTEMSVLAERLDETVAKLDAQDSSISSLARVVETIVDRVVDRVADRLQTPFAQLDGRLDGVTGRFEGVAGRMDGLEDRLGGLHKRLDDLDRHEMRLDGLPAAVTGPLRERVDAVDTGLRDRLDDLARGVSEEITGTREAARTDATTTRDDTTTQVGELTARLETLTARLDQVGTRLDGVESGLTDRVVTLSTSVENGLDRLDGTLVNRPDHEAVVALVRQANEKSERRNAGHLDEAMATFAEIILGPGAGSPSAMPAPRPTARRSARKPAGRDTHVNGSEMPTENTAVEG